MKYKFQLPIGDWSSDGHGRCDWYTISSSRPLDEVREAYFKAKEVVPEDLHPENICNEYEERTIPKDKASRIEEISGIVLSDDWDWVDQDRLIQYILWFIVQGDPTLTLNKEDSKDMLPFYGVDSKGRHIGSFGYGLFE